MVKMKRARRRPAAVALAAAATLLTVDAAAAQSTTSRTEENADDNSSDPALSRPRSPATTNRRLGERLGQQTSRSPAPIGHKRLAPSPATPLPTQPLVDADVELPQ